MADETTVGSPGEKVARTGTYRCAICGPDGMLGGRVTVITGGAVQEVKSESATARYFSEGETFSKCPGCLDLARRAGSPIGATGSWVFISEEKSSEAAGSGCSSALLFLTTFIALGLWLCS